MLYVQFCITSVDDNGKDTYSLGGSPVIMMVLGEENRHQSLIAVHKHKSILRQQKLKKKEKKTVQTRWTTWPYFCRHSTMPVGFLLINVWEAASDTS